MKKRGASRTAIRRTSSLRRRGDPAALPPRLRSTALAVPFAIVSQPKTIVVVGGARGLGRGLVEAFLASSCNVVFSARSDATVRAALQDLQPRYPDRCAAIVADAASRDDAERLFRHAEERFGAVDVWIQNAGVSNTQSDFLKLASSDVDTVVETNLVGAMRAAHVVLPRMIAAQRGHFFTMEGYGSNGDTRAGMSLYAASKSGLRSFTRALVLELQGGPVRVGSLSPGVVVTDLLVDVYKAGDAQHWAAQRRLLRLIADPVEVVAPWIAARVLASPAHGAHAAWMTVGKAVLRALSPWQWGRDPFAGRLP